MFGTSVGAALQRSLTLYPDHPAIEFDGSVLTYADLDRWSGQVADLLLGLGVGPGTRVAVLSGNCPEFLVAMVAVARAGAVKVPINPVLPQATIRYALDLSDTAVLVVGSEFVEKARGTIEGLERHIHVVQFGVANRLDGAIELPALDRNAPRRCLPLDHVTPDMPAAVQFTGGTTGRPKGVLHTQRAFMSYHIAQIAEAEIRRHERMLLMTPLAHAAGNLAETALIRGATVVLHRGFSVPEAVRAICEEGITWCFLVPTMLYRLLDQWPEDAPGELALDTIVYGAAPISPRRLEEALRRFGPVFIQLYGQTECPNWGTRLSKSDHDPANPERLTSCGQASLMVDVKVVDDDGKEVPHGETGEICLRSPYLLSEYVKDPEATAAKFLDDYIRTGDIGVMDADGFVYLKDRKADMIITGGMNVYSREVEDVLQAHPAVASAAVVGLPDDDWGEAVTAAIVVHDAVDGAQLKAWCRERLAAYAIPKRMHFVDALPETPYGKVDKVALRNLLLGGATAQTVVP